MRVNFRLGMSVAMGSSYFRAEFQLYKPSKEYETVLVEIVHIK